MRWFDVDEESLINNKGYNNHSKSTWYVVFSFEKHQRIIILLSSESNFSYLVLSERAPLVEH